MTKLTWLNPCAYRGVYEDEETKVITYPFSIVSMIEEGYCKGECANCPLALDDEADEYFNDCDDTSLDLLVARYNKSLETK